jgi:hypothetical protein
VVEQRFRKPSVAGSIPAIGSTIKSRVLATSEGFQYQMELQKCNSFATLECVKMNLSCKPARASDWPQKVTIGRVSVRVYRRKTRNGAFGYMVANYADGVRRFDSHATEADAMEAARNLARQLSERDVLGASLTNEQASDYASAIQSLAPFNLSLPATVSTVAECLKLLGDLPSLHAAAKFYATRHKQIVKRPVSEVIPISIGPN